MSASGDMNERNRLVEERYLAGATIRELAADVGVTFQRIQQLIRKAENEGRLPAGLGAQRSAEMRPRSIAAMHSHEVLQRKCRNHRERLWPAEKATFVRSLIDRGFTLQAVADLAGRSFAQVYAFCRENNIQLRPDKGVTSVKLSLAAKLTWEDPAVRATRGRWTPERRKRASDARKAWWAARGEAT